MKRLTLIRHAKSSWHDDNLADFERPLNKRGRRDAPLMAQRLAARNPAIDYWLASPARRAKHTVAAFAGALAIPIDRIDFESSVYAANAGDLLAVIRGVDAGAQHALLVGHNPAITAIANRLIGAGDNEIDNMPTCGVLTLRLDIDRWTETGNTRSMIEDFDYPKKP